MYYEHKIESIKEIPTYETIFNFNSKEIENFYNLLHGKYFPSEREGLELKYIFNIKKLNKEEKEKLKKLGKELGEKLCKSEYF